MARLPGPAQRPGSRRNHPDAPKPNWATDEDIARVRMRLQRKEAVWWFDFVKDEARRSGLLTQLDLSLFQEWAETKAAWEIQNNACIEWENALPAASVESERQMSMFPRCYALRNRYSKHMRDIEAQIGFSPAARTRIAAASAQIDLFDDLLTVGIEYQAEIPRRA